MFWSVTGSSFYERSSYVDPPSWEKCYMLWYCILGGINLLALGDVLVFSNIWISNSLKGVICRTISVKLPTAKCQRTSSAQFIWGKVKTYLHFLSDCWKSSPWKSRIHSSCSLYNGCWWPGNASIQGISSHRSDLDILQHSSINPNQQKCEKKSFMQLLMLWKKFQ